MGLKTIRGQNSIRKQLIFEIFFLTNSLSVLKMKLSDYW